MFNPRRMLFPVDFSEPCVAMAPLVAAFARHFHAGLTLLHVLPANPTDEHRVQAQEDLHAFAWPQFSGMSTCPVIVEGEPAEAILKYAREQRVELIMMPTHGYGPFRRFILGSVAQRVLREAACPVWTDVHHALPMGTDSAGQGNLQVRNVICAIDLSPESRTALRWAAGFAADMSAKLTIVHAVARALPTPELPVDWTPQMEQAALDEIERLQKCEGTHADARVVTGEVAQAVHDAVEAAGGDVLVIGRGPEEHGFARLMDHAYPIVRHAPCPVVSV
jgi:nucleotide-binding universal stress UspA family protein